MAEKKELFGLEEDGSIVEGDKINFPTTIAVAEGKGILGEEIKLPDGKCVIDYPEVDPSSSSEMLDIIIGDPRVVRGVKLIEDCASEELTELLDNIPDEVIKAFPNDWILVFENEDGERLYVLDGCVRLYDPKLFSEN